MIAPRGGHDAAHLGAIALQTVEIGDAAADLECAGRRMVLMLDPDFAAGTGSEQGPGIACGGGECRMHESGGGFKLGKGEHARRIAQDPAEIQGPDKEKGRPADAGAALLFSRG